MSDEFKRNDTSPATSAPLMEMEVRAFLDTELRIRLERYATLVKSVNDNEVVLNDLLGQVHPSQRSEQLTFHPSEQYKNSLGSLSHPEMQQFTSLERQVFRQQHSIAIEIQQGRVANSKRERDDFRESLLSLVTISLQDYFALPQEEFPKRLIDDLVTNFEKIIASAQFLQNYLPRMEAQTAAHPLVQVRAAPSLPLPLLSPSPASPQLVVQVPGSASAAPAQKKRGAPAQKKEISPDLERLLFGVDPKAQNFLGQDPRQIGDMLASVFHNFLSMDNK
jgi:hypothetical protein